MPVANVFFSFLLKQIKTDPGIDQVDATEITEGIMTI